MRIRDHRAAKLRRRRAFLTVINQFNDIRSVLGQAGCVDYSRLSGGKGPIYATDRGKAFRLIDFTIDVRNILERNLTAEELSFVKATLYDKEIDLTVQSEAFMKLQERIGRLFIGRGLYPVSKYFNEVKLCK